MWTKLASDSQKPTYLSFCFPSAKLKVMGSIPDSILTKQLWKRNIDDDRRPRLMTWVPFPGPTWWKKRTDFSISCPLPSTDDPYHIHLYTHKANLEYIIELFHMGTIMFCIEPWFSFPYLVCLYFICVLVSHIYITIIFMNWRLQFEASIFSHFYFILGIHKE